jgi:biopolymer transport protein ExbB/TolQ
VQEILEQVLTEAEKIFLIAKDFCVENYIEVLIGMNVFAILLAIIGIAKAAKALKESRKNGAIEVLGTDKKAKLEELKKQEEISEQDEQQKQGETEPEPAAETAESEPAVAEAETIAQAEQAKTDEQSASIESVDEIEQELNAVQADTAEQVAPADPVEAFEQAEPAKSVGQTESATSQGGPVFNFNIDGDDKATLRLNIERADICIANVERINRQFEDKLVSESTPETASEAAMAEIQELHEAAEAAGLGEEAKPSEPSAKEEQDMQGDGLNVFVQTTAPIQSVEAPTEETISAEVQAAADTQPAEPIVIEKLIPIETEKIDPGKFYTSKSGIVYSEEEIASKIKD